MANHSDTLLRATLDGTGISAQPLDLVTNCLRDGQLQRVLAPWITGRFTLYAALPSRKYVPARARVFMEFLIEQTGLKAAAVEATRPLGLDNSRERAGWVCCLRWHKRKNPPGHCQGGGFAVHPARRPAWRCDWGSSAAGG